MEITDAKIYHDLDCGIIEGKDVVKSVKYYKDAKSFYASEDESLDDDTIMYEVYAFTNSEKSCLNYGLTVMQPVKVNGEYNMTRGHFHLDTTKDEIYIGLEGEGLLLYMDENGKCFSEKVKRGSVHYIDGKLAHRLINTGDKVMKVQCFWPSDAGHDYKRVEKMPFSERVFEK